MIALLAALLTTEYGECTRQAPVWIWAQGHELDMVSTSHITICIMDQRAERLLGVSAFGSWE